MNTIIYDNPWDLITSSVQDNFFFKRRQYLINDSDWLIGMVIMNHYWNNWIGIVFNNLLNSSVFLYYRIYRYNFNAFNFRYLFNFDLMWILCFFLYLLGFFLIKFFNNDFLLILLLRLLLK
jgi:hypothetical protein